MKSIEPGAGNANGSLLVAVLLLASAPVSGSEALSARFVGNQAFEITDGQTTLLTDFPYQSGAFDYMTYDGGELRPRERALCLITHRHADHFEASLVARIGCRVFGPPDVLALLPKASAVAVSPPVRLWGMTITPVKTDLAKVQHFSYLVEWKGVRLYFTGDTESTKELAAQGPLDALFISPWLLDAARRAGTLPESARVIVYHHQAGENVPPCPRCVVPRQRETIDLPAKIGNP
jgi:hypothetical protein